MEEADKHKQIELRSEEVQEIMGSIPPWILRWGITILFIVVLSMLIGSFFFKYPDVIVSEMTLTSRNPVAQIVARSSGKISSLYVTDGQEVKTKNPLAIIENPASTEDVMYLKSILLPYQNNPDSLINHLTLSKELALGEIQSSYVGFLRSLHDYANYHTLNYFQKKIAAMQGQIQKHQTYFQNLKRQLQVIDAQYAIAAQQYNRDSLLFVRQVLSPSEHETSRSTFLQSRYSLETANASLDNMKIQMGDLETNLLDMELQKAEKESVLLQDFNSSVEQLTNAINSWELTYCLTSPIDGKVTFIKYWNENQYIPTGENIFTIVPNEKEELVGKALLPIQRSGKVKVGQRVIVRFANFPDQEFGIVNGVVNSISLVPADNNYQVEITFPNGLTTNYKKTLPVTHEMKASADIVTEDLRLIERFFMPLKRILKEGL